MPTDRPSIENDRVPRYIVITAVTSINTKANLSPFNLDRVIRYGSRTRGNLAGNMTCHIRADCHAID